MEKKEEDLKVEETESSEKKEENKKDNGGKKAPNMKNVMIYGGIAAVLVVIIIILNSFSGKGAIGIAQKYANAYKDLDAAAVVELLPKELVEYSKEANVDLEKSLEEEFQAIKDEDIKIKSVTVEESKKLSEEDIKKAKYKIELYQIKVEDVSEATIFKIVMTAENKDGDTKEADDKITVLKVNGQWTLLPFEIS